ncbi:MAG: hypothetical protein LQ342_007227 [Letrouitia transgressa]|nr:MAG: hypothetical protein LQ342_007227 [Letrouitia transgressa]
MTVAELVGDKFPADFGLEASHETAPFTKIASILWDQRFRVVEENQSMRLEVLRGPTTLPRLPVSTSTTPPPIQARNRYYREICQKSRSYWNLFLLKTKYYVRQMSIWMNGSPYPFLLRPLALTLWIIFLSLVFAANAYIVHDMTGLQQLADQNYVPPSKPSLYIVVGVLIQSIFQVLDQNLRSLTPLSALRQGFQPPSVLFTDFSSSRPILEIFLALAHGHTLLATVMLTSYVAALYTILLGALQVSASFYGATTFASDLACAIATLALNAWFWITSVAVGWNYCGWRYRGDIGGRRFLTRDPATIGAMMPFLLNSGKLQEDVAAVKRIEGSKDKIRCLEEQGRRYGFGRFKDREGREHVGVERNETISGGGTHVWTSSRDRICNPSRLASIVFGAYSISAAPRFLASLPRPPPAPFRPLMSDEQPPGPELSNRETGYIPGDGLFTRWHNTFRALTGHMTREGQLQWKRDMDDRNEQSDIEKCRKYREFLLQYS